MTGTLYQRLCQTNLLREAWDLVKQKGSAGGIDKVQTGSFEEQLSQNLDELRNDLAEKTYVPRPYKQLAVKKEKGGKRSLGLPSVRDKIVQVAVKILVEPIFEKLFLNISYAYRPQKGPLKAINKARHLIQNEKRDWITLCDIDKYFDSIPHDGVLKMFAEHVQDEYIIHLVELWLKIGKISGEYTWRDNITGTPQGGIISPLLSNLYLHPLDCMMVEKKYGYIRYADDFIVLSRKEGEAFRALEDVRDFIVNRLSLTLNPGASVKKISEGFDYLGIRFIGNELSLSDEKFRKIRESMALGVKFSNGVLHEDIQDVLNGISRYYARIIPQEKLEMIDLALIRILKDKCYTAWSRGIIGDKKQLAQSLDELRFFSESMQGRKQMLMDEVIASLQKPKVKKAPGTKPTPDVKKLVRREKRSYQKLESQGMELVVNTPGIFLGKTRNSITVKDKGRKVNEVRLDHLRNIMILSQGVTLSSNIIAHCASHNISLDFIGFDGKPYATLYAPFYQSQQAGEGQAEAFTNGKASLVARKIVNAKIRNQLYLVKYYHKYRKTTDDDFNRDYTENSATMEKLAKEAVEIEAPDHETLRGKLFSTEGRAAQCYWNQIALYLNDYISFEGRVRQGASDTVNCLLNYGYGILYSRIWEAVTRARMNPYISFLHKPQHGKPTLVYDMIEEFRQQAVDRVVFAMIAKGEPLKVEKGYLDSDTRRRLAEKISLRLQTVIRYKKQETRLADLIFSQARLLHDYLCGEEKKYKPYVGTW